jgi:hypothetical protein
MPPPWIPRFVIGTSSAKLPTKTANDFVGRPPTQTCINRGLSHNTAALQKKPWSFFLDDDFEYRPLYVLTSVDNCWLLGLTITLESSRITI